jgi:hypothetical protein
MIRLTLEYDTEIGTNVCISREFNQDFGDEGIGFAAGTLMDMSKGDLKPNEDWFKKTYDAFELTFKPW